jgi:hypothetical protein
MKIRIPQSTNKTRAHRVLFDTTLPFRPRTQRDRTQYSRRPKHRNSEFNHA